MNVGSAFSTVPSAAAQHQSKIGHNQTCQPIIF
jgi:hypothetical protein